MIAFVIRNYKIHDHVHAKKYYARADPMFIYRAASEQRMVQQFDSKTVGNPKYEDFTANTRPIFSKPRSTTGWRYNTVGND